MNLSSQDKCKLKNILELLKIVDLAQWEIEHREYDEAEKTIKYLKKGVFNV